VRRGDSGTSQMGEQGEGAQFQLGGGGGGGGPNMQLN